MSLIKKVREHTVIDSTDIYKSNVIEMLMENDELSYEEAGFMQGYNQG